MLAGVRLRHRLNELPLVRDLLGDLGLPARNRLAGSAGLQFFVWSNRFVIQNKQLRNKFKHSMAVRLGLKRALKWILGEG